MGRRLIGIQAALVLLCMAAFWFSRGESHALAALYGGGVAMASAWLLSSKVERAGEMAKKSVKWSIYSLLFGAVQRFVFVLIALALGMWQGGLGLHPVPILIAFGVAQLAYMIAMSASATRL